jgi:hypothetical protein
MVAEVSKEVFPSSQDGDGEVLLSSEEVSFNPQNYENKISLPLNESGQISMIAQRNLPPQILARQAAARAREAQELKEYEEGQEGQQALKRQQG